MSIRQQLLDQMKDAMKARDAIRLNTIRFVISQAKNAEIDLKREMTDEELIKLMQKEVKNRAEAIEQFQSAGRTELVEEEQAKLEVIKSFLPAEMPDEELEKIVDDVVTEHPNAQFGELMREVMTKVKGQASGSRVSALLKGKVDSKI